MALKGSSILNSRSLGGQGSYFYSRLHGLQALHLRALCPPFDGTWPKGPNYMVSRVSTFEIVRMVLGRYLLVWYLDPSKG